MNKDYEINFATIQRLINEHKGALDRLNMLYKLYKKGSKITDRQMENGKPNNKITNFYPKYIVDTSNGYFLGKPVKIKSSNEILLEKINEINRYNDEASHNMTMGKKSSIFGRSYEVLYLDERKDIRFKALDPREIIYVVANNLEETPLFAIRYYENVFLDDVDYVVEVYDTECMNTYHYCEEKKKFDRCDDVIRHPFKDVPINPLIVDEEEMGLFESVISQCYAYDLTQSDTANDFEYFTNCLLLLFGDIDAEVDEETGQPHYDFMNKRVIHFLEKKGETGAEWLTKQINDTALENYKKRLQQDIHKFSNVPDMSDVNFGNTSGESLKWKILGLETMTGNRENYFTKMLTRRNELICNALSLKNNETLMLDIEYVYTRNTPRNFTELVGNVRNLDGTLSRKSRIEMIPDIDIDEEMKRIEEEEQNSPISYGVDFRNLADEDDNDGEEKDSENENLGDDK